MSINSEYKRSGFLRLMLLGFVFSSAQFTEFKGGTLNLDVEGNWSPFGVTSQTGARGAMAEITTLYPNAASPFGNPAALSRLKGLGIQSDFFLPGMGLGVSSEHTKLLRSNFRAPIQTLLENPKSKVTDPSYPNSNVSLYQASGLSGFCLAYGGSRFSFGVGVEQSFSGKVNASLGGFRVGMATLVDSTKPTGDSVHLKLAGDAFAQIGAEINDFAAAVSLIPHPKVRLGFAMHRYTFDARLDAAAHVDGIMQRGRQLGIYNLPNVPYTNNLNAFGYGRLHGEAHGFRLGAAWDFTRHLGMDALLSLASSARLVGRIDALYHLILAVEPGTWIEADWVNSGKPALTQRQAYHLSEFEFVLPWEAGVSFRFQSSRIRVNLDYLYYLRGLSVGYKVQDSVTVFDSKTNDILRGGYGKDSNAVSKSSQAFRINLKHNVSVGFEYDQVFLHVGALFYGVSEQYDVGESASFQPSFFPFLPTLNLGYYFPLGPHFNATVSLAALPVSLFKTSVEYRY